MATMKLSERQKTMAPSSILDGDDALKAAQQGRVASASAPRTGFERSTNSHAGPRSQPTPRPLSAPHHYLSRHSTADGTVSATSRVSARTSSKLPLCHQGKRPVADSQDSTAAPAAALKKGPHGPSQWQSSSKSLDGSPSRKAHVGKKPLSEASAQPVVAHIQSVWTKRPTIVPSLRPHICSRMAVPNTAQQADQQCVDAALHDRVAGHDLTSVEASNLEEEISRKEQPEAAPTHQSAERLSTLQHGKSKSLDTLLSTQLTLSGKKKDADDKAHTTTERTGRRHDHDVQQYQTAHASNAPAGPVKGGEGRLDAATLASYYAGGGPEPVHPSGLVLLPSGTTLYGGAGQPRPPYLMQAYLMNYAPAGYVGLSGSSTWLCMPSSTSYGATSYEEVSSLSSTKMDHESSLYAAVQSLMPTEEEKTRHEEIFLTLGSIVKQTFPTAELLRFGSTVNGFSLRAADLDFCLFIDEDSAAGPSNKMASANVAAHVITLLGEALKNHPRCANIKVLSRARVPIIKLSCQSGGSPAAGTADMHSPSEPALLPPLWTSCDIGVNNRLAIHNTQLLKTYSLVDGRVVPLAILIKYWAKRRDLNEPYWGTLSSYCFLIMIIYYLQRCRPWPPVLPVLQSRTLGLEQAGGVPGGVKKAVFAPRWVDGYDVGYFSDLDKLSEYWPDGAQDDDSKDNSTGHVSNACKLSELLHGFFHYYAHEFPYAQAVISIRGLPLGEGTRADGENGHGDTQSSLPSPYLSKESKGWLTSLSSDVVVHGQASSYPGSTQTAPALPSSHHLVNYWFCVEDPFETSHNLARVVTKATLYYIRGQFMRAAKLTARGASLSILCSDQLFD